MKRKSAFTFTEMMCCFAVLTVLIAICTPTVVTNVNINKRITIFKKGYKALQDVLAYNTENNLVLGPDTVKALSIKVNGAKDYNSHPSFDTISVAGSTVKDKNSNCLTTSGGNPAGLNEDCVITTTTNYTDANETVTDLFYNNMRASNFKTSGSGDEYSFTTKDGAKYIFSEIKLDECTDIPNDELSDNYLKNDPSTSTSTSTVQKFKHCMRVTIDTDGDKGANTDNTNTSGITKETDQFVFYVYKNEVVPFQVNVEALTTKDFK